MKIKLTLAALCLVIFPAAAFAVGCHGSDTMGEQASMSCADGMTFDTDANTCVSETTS